MVLVKLIHYNFYMDSRFDFESSRAEISALWNSVNIANPDIVRTLSYSALAYSEQMRNVNQSSKVQKNSHRITSPRLEPYVLVLPPPNLTGILHMGHGLNCTVQDSIIRFNRMLGREVLWLPGTDHAGIATQQKVEAELKSKHKTKEALGRTAFWEYTKQFAEKNKDTILMQFEMLGASFDLGRYSFTLDEKRAQAVFHCFKTLYDRGLIYKGNYLVNWSPGAGTALSDDEVEYKEVQGHLYYINYQLVPPSALNVTSQQDRIHKTDIAQNIKNETKVRHIQIATTRPETLLGDTAVAVHPEDPRYVDFVEQGYSVRIPVCGRIVPLIADARVSQEFGTGAVKVTPAHDKNDYALGIAHELAFMSVIDEHACMQGDIPNEYRGLSVGEARSKIIEVLEQEGHLVCTKPHVHQVGHCHRTGTVVQFLLSEQWYVRMHDMAQKALQAWKRGDIVFYPQTWEKTFEHWLTHVRDWCISRQLWWGHRIPVWYHRETGEAIVSISDPSDKKGLEKNSYVQDKNVLDTWFSSWLWPLSTIGWPQHTKEFIKYYPNTSLVTAYDIIFFWVARMIMAGIEFTGLVPFKHIYLHGLVRDAQGRKMSKSLGNGIDPIELIHEIGPDALRFTLVYMCAQGRDVLISKDSFQLGTKFVTKVWNASRFVLASCENVLGGSGEIMEYKEVLKSKHLKLVDRWIVGELQDCARVVERAMSQYRVDEAAHEVYKFFWNSFCDWYIEFSKFYIQVEDDFNKDRADKTSKPKTSKAATDGTRIQSSATVLLVVLQQSLRLLHPFIPFVTEKIYQLLQDRFPFDSDIRHVLAAEAYPHIDHPDTFCHDITNIVLPHFSTGDNTQKKTETREMSKSREATEISELQELISELRRVRSELQLPKKLKLDVCFVELKDNVSIYKHKDLIEFLALIKLLDSENRECQSIKVVGSFFEARVYITNDDYDFSAQTQLIRSRLSKLHEQEKSLSKQLSNPQFTQKAKPEYREKIRLQYETLVETTKKLASILDSVE